ncbi:hypothetical protein ACR30L_03820 [Psychromonas sp. PT13]
MRTAFDKQQLPNERNTGASALAELHQTLHSQQHKSEAKNKTNIFR